MYSASAGSNSSKAYPGISTRATDPSKASISASMVRRGQTVTIASPAPATTEVARWPMGKVSPAPVTASNRITVPTSWFATQT